MECPPTNQAHFIALTGVLARLVFRDRSKETVGCYGALVGSALSIRAEYMRSGFGDGQSWRCRIDEMSFFWIVFTSQATSYMPGYQCSQVKQPPNKRLTSQVFIYQQLQRPVTACSNVLESALHGNKSYNSYSQPARFDLLPHYLFKE